MECSTVKLQYLKNHCRWEAYISNTRQEKVDGQVDLQFGGGHQNGQHFFNFDVKKNTHFQPYLS
jgi:hypothetical protein